MCSVLAFEKRCGNSPHKTQDVSGTLDQTDAEPNQTSLVFVRVNHDSQSQDKELVVQISPNELQTSPKLSIRGVSWASPLSPGFLLSLGRPRSCRCPLQWDWDLPLSMRFPTTKKTHVVSSKRFNWKPPMDPFQVLSWKQWKPALKHTTKAEQRRTASLTVVLFSWMFLQKTCSFCLTGWICCSWHTGVMFKKTNCVFFQECPISFSVLSGGQIRIFSNVCRHLRTWDIEESKAIGNASSMWKTIQSRGFHQTPNSW